MKDIDYKVGYTLFLLNKPSYLELLKNAAISNISLLDCDESLGITREQFEQSLEEHFYDFLEYGVSMATAWFDHYLRNINLLARMLEDMPIEIEKNVKNVINKLIINNIEETIDYRRNEIVIDDDDEIILYKKHRYNIAVIALEKVRNNCELEFNYAADYYDRYMKYF